MKKKFLIGLASLAIMAVAVCVTVSGINANTTDSSLLSKNLEALTKQENDCPPNTFGYKSWDKEADWFEDEKEFYDCCTVLRHGYDPSGNCS